VFYESKKEEGAENVNQKAPENGLFQRAGTGSGLGLMKENELIYNAKRTVVRDAKKQGLHLS
jgi:hypothetical protein